MATNIVVTGGSRGIGRAVALRGGALGGSVGVGYYPDQGAAEGVVEAVEAAGGRAVAVAVAGDVSDEADVLELFDATERAFGSSTASSSTPGWSARHDGSWTCLRSACAGSSTST